MKHISLPHPRFIGLAGFLALCMALGLALYFGQTAQAKALPDAPVTQPGQVNNETCLACHSRPSQFAELSGGEKLYVTIDTQTYGASAHGQNSMACTTCHSNISGYPHPENAAATLRDYSLQYKENCKVCHQKLYDLTAQSVHAKAFDAGNQNAAICSDCHNPHTQPKLQDENGVLKPEVRVEIGKTCARCHNEIYEAYAKSAHGQALIAEGNPDVPTCVDCHGVHQIADPTTAAYRNSSIQLCARCHTDEKIMAKYGLSTQVLNTYISDFHGTTVTLFEKNSPDEMTNKPVCYDCHGVHAIARVDDPQAGLQVRQNLSATCKKCHPDANLNFPDSWMSHYIPSPQHYPLVYYVQLFYKIFIPLVLGSMAIYVLIDFVHGLIARRKHNAPKTSA